MPVKFEPITPTLGAYVHVTPDAAAAPDAAAGILEALDRHHVLIFPQVHMSDEGFLELTAALGERHEIGVTDDGSAASSKGIFRIALDKDDATQGEFIRGNDFWHMDGMNYAGPVKATLLKCESGPKEGGDTGFANLHAAYDALPDKMKRSLEGLKVGHCLSASLRRLYDAPTADDFQRWDNIFPRMERPLVWTQKCGKTSLLIGGTANDIVGMSEADGRQLLDELVDWCTQDRFTYRHTWQAGDLVIFNNPALLHRSYPYSHAAGRVMHRTTLKGLETFGADADGSSVGLY
jgi:alpha-ketoglutarate-dependent taurine dioxygenase